MRQLVIPDIHGFSDTLIELCNKVGINKQDQVIFLGDYIDRGPGNKEVLDFLINLKNDGYNTVFLKGNHEDMLIRSHEAENKEDEEMIPSLYKRNGLLDKNKKILPQYISFFMGLLPYFETNNHICVHAGINFSAPSPMLQQSFMCWSSTSLDENQAPPKTVIHGHFTRNINDIEHQIVGRESVIGIDNGIYKKTTEGMGSLLCLELNTYKLYRQKNID